MSIPVLLALAAPGLGVDRVRANSVLRHIDAANAGARIASYVLQETVRSPFQTEVTPAEKIGKLEPDDTPPSEDERESCPGIVFQTVVLGPHTAALDEMAALFKVNALQREFLHMVNRNVVTILDGPPGTGKTSALLPLVTVWAREAPPGWTVLVTAGSNSALDNIMWRLIEAIRILGIDLDATRLVRFARGDAIKDTRVYPYTPDGVYESRFHRPPERATARTSQPSRGS